MTHLVVEDSILRQAVAEVDQAEADGRYCGVTDR